MSVGGYTVIGEFGISMAANIVSEAGKAILKRARPWLAEALGSQTEIAESRAFANAASFVAEVDERIQQLEASQPEGFRRELLAALEDPDVLATVRIAVITGARSSSEERHRVLAGVVAERLGLKSDSAKAAAGNLAVTAVSNLGMEHLQVLGLLALIHAARPADDTPPEPRRDDYKDFVERRGERFAGWLQKSLGAHGIPGRRSAALTSHLVAAACVIHEPEVKRDLSDALRPREYTLDNLVNHRVPHSLYPYGLSFAKWMKSEPSHALRQCWATQLQFLEPTPAGLLIGLAVHDARTGDNQVAHWEWSIDEAEVSARRPDTSVLTSKKFDVAVWEAVEDKLKQMARTGHPLPWEYIR
jgi:hypothetical protein